MKRTATAITQNPYINLVNSDDDEDDDNQPDARIFQAPPGYPYYLKARDKVKAKNGYIFTMADKNRKKNIENCSYERPLPSRGNCCMCGRSGPLGETCTNGCKYESWASENLNLAAKERQYKNDPDLAIQAGDPTNYRIFLTPKKGNMIDAVYWAEMMYQGVHEEQENYREFSQKPKEEREKKHDKIRADLEKWEDPWLWVFRLHDDCQWWNTCSVVSESMGNYLENPRPGKRHKYV